MSSNNIKINEIAIANWCFKPSQPVETVTRLKPEHNDRCTDCNRHACTYIYMSTKILPNASNGPGVN